MAEQWGKYYNVLDNHLGYKTAKGNRTKYILRNHVDFLFMNWMPHFSAGN